MADFTKLDDVLNMIKKAQEAEYDIRENSRTAKSFIIDPDGQWDDDAKNKMADSYRGTFDMCTPIVDQISGEIEQSDFTIKVSPAGSESSMDTAKTLDGLIRNIRNLSNAEDVFSKASRTNVIQGFDAWEAVQEFVDDDSFDQDLLIKYIPNAIDSVWFDLSAVAQDKHDAMWAVKLVAMPTDEYKDRFPDGSGQSVGQGKRRVREWQKAESVVVGKLYYKKSTKVDLVRMSNGEVYTDDEEFKKIVDELEQAGIVEEDRRTKDKFIVHTRIFDGDEWLDDEEETVFSFIPLIPIYGNYDIVDNKVIFYGKIEKLYDQQRALNYALSRDINDGALSPRAKYWLTAEQMEGYEDTISTLNTNNDPAQLYNHVPDQLPPQMQGGAQPNAALQTTVANMQQMINTSANSFNAQQGNANALQSGIAGQQQIDQGNIGSIKWFASLQVAVCHTARVLIDAIPRVYDATRQVRILDEDGTGNIVTLNTTVFDEETQQNVEVNDLTKGKYDVVCDYGPAFNSQQKETVQAFLDMAAIDPTFLEQGKDIMLKNLSVPGMDQMAERARRQLFIANQIPEDQLTDKERQEIAEAQAQAAQQPPQEDPLMVAARAEEGKAQAELMKSQNQQQQTQIDAQVKMANVQLEQEKIALEREKLQLDAAKFQRAGEAKFNTDLIQADQNQQKIDLQAQEQQFNSMMKMMEQKQTEMDSAINNLKVLKDAIGADTIIGDTNTQVYKEQADIVLDKQDEE
ncbi:MAG: hypothetical protein GY787_06315 [Alteromonadales bacterium]|nr:hypothetical protein [Alteromonadales bacterium]